MEAFPVLISPYYDALFANLHKPKIHDSVKRNTVRLLQFAEIPEEQQGIVATTCFGYLLSDTEATAVKIFSITVLCNICKQQPELKNELVAIIEDQMPYASAGFKVRGRLALKELSKIKYAS